MSARESLKAVGGEVHAPEDRQACEHFTAIVLAAGKGSRMKSDVPKQFLATNGGPLIVRTLRVFQDSPEISDILLVTSPDYVDYCRNLSAQYDLPKVRKIVEGGKERYDSVWNALCACPDADYVLIHDGARPFITEEIIGRCCEAVRLHKAVAVGMPSKDTVKIADEDGFVQSTPARKNVWTIQTPQAFSRDLIVKANEKLRKRPKGMAGVTDDAMIVEASGLAKVKLIEGSYENIKITTPDDLRYL